MAVFCKNCGKELKENEKPCPFCGCSNKKYIMDCLNGSFKIAIGALKWKHKRPGLGTIMEGVNRPFKVSGDPKLPEGVSEIYVIDRIKKTWHQIVTDLKTGIETHKESISLKEKNKH
jgi:hypothetical protein